MAALGLGASDIWASLVKPNRVSLAASGSAASGAELSSDVESGWGLATFVSCALHAEDCALLPACSNLGFLRVVAVPAAVRGFLTALSFFSFSLSPSPG